MATQHQSDIARLTAGGGARAQLSVHVTLTMVAGAPVTDSTFTPPAGTRVSKISWHTSTSFTGSPTNIYLTCGKTAGGADYVANTDVKTASPPTACTMVAQPDYDSWTAGQSIFSTLTANGGATPAGSVVIVYDFAPLTTLA